MAGGASVGVWRTGLIARIDLFAPRFRRAVPSAPGVGRTRHPVSGAVWRPKLLYGNLLEMRQLAAFTLLWPVPTGLWFPYGNLLILLGVRRRPPAYL